MKAGGVDKSASALPSLKMKTETRKTDEAASIRRRRRRRSEVHVWGGWWVEVACAMEGGRVESRGRGNCRRRAVVGARLVLLNCLQVSAIEESAGDSACSRNVYTPVLPSPPPPPHPQIKITNKQQQQDLFVTEHHQRRQLSQPQPPKRKREKERQTERKLSWVYFDFTDVIPTIKKNDFGFFP